MTTMRGAGSRRHNWVVWEHAWFQPSARVATYFMPSSYPSEGPGDGMAVTARISPSTDRRTGAWPITFALALGRPP